MFEKFNKIFRNKMLSEGITDFNLEVTLKIKTNLSRLRQ